MKDSARSRAIDRAVDAICSTEDEPRLRQAITDFCARVHGTRSIWETLARVRQENRDYEEGSA